MMNTMLFEEIFLSKQGKEKKLRIIHGDLCREERDMDLVICSAYKNRYYPTGQSVIGSLFWEKNISVDMLSMNPSIDMRNMGFWLSEEIDSNFKRIGCLELLEYGADKNNVAIILKSKFSTLRYVLEQAACSEIPVATVAMPLVGAGEEGIELPYIASVLYQQMELALTGIDEVEEINIYEKDEEKAKQLRDIFESLQDIHRETEEQQVFISYSSKQSDQAHCIKEAIEARGYRCWIAPECIPIGKSYLSEIPAALKKVQVVVLLLTQEAEASIWVIKEIGTALGKRKVVIPYRNQIYPLGDEFAFLLENVQILTGEAHEETYQCLLEEIEKNIVR